MLFHVVFLEPGWRTRWPRLLRRLARHMQSMAVLQGAALVHSKEGSVSNGIWSEARISVQLSACSNIRYSISTFSNLSFGYIRNASLAEIEGLAPALDKEVDDLVRMHLHLAERINNEVVHPLQTFLANDAWKVAKQIEGKIYTMADEMSGHHEMIPKLSARTISKSAKASQQAAQKLEEEKRSLMLLQQRWQNEIFSLVDDFETADVARIEIIRDSVFKFEHYRSEFLKAGLAGVSPALDIANSIKPNARIIEVLGKDVSHKRQPTKGDGDLAPAEQPKQQGGADADKASVSPVSATGSTEASSGVRNLNGSQEGQSSYEPTPEIRNASIQSPYASAAASPAPQHGTLEPEAEHEVEDGQLSSKSSKGFMKFNIFRSKTKWGRKKSRTPEESVGAKPGQLNRSTSSNLSSAYQQDPGNNNNMQTAGTPSIRTANTYDTKDSETQSIEPSGLMPGEFPTTSHQRGESLLSVHSSRFTDGRSESILTPSVAPPLSPRGVKPSGSDEFAEWVFDNENGGDGDDNGSKGAESARLPLNAASNRLSIIKEVPDKPTDSEAEDQGESSIQHTNGHIAATEQKLDAPGTNAWPELSQNTDAGNSTAGDKDTVFDAFDSVRFDETQSPLHIADSASPLNSQLAALPQPVAVQEAAPVDLDSAFSVPAPLPRTEAAAVSDKNGGFGADSAFLPAAATEAKESPLWSNANANMSSRHKRSASAGVSGSPAIGGDGQESENEDDSGDENKGDSEDEDAADQTFRVKFSIRDNAIKDNPDESKAALTRVTTLLRGAPTVRRRNRRDVRTMYVPSTNEPAVDDIVNAAFGTQAAEESAERKADSLGAVGTAEEESPSVVKSETVGEAAVAEAFGLVSAPADGLDKNAAAETGSGSSKDGEIKGGDDDDVPLARTALSASQERIHPPTDAASQPQRSLEGAEQVSSTPVVATAGVVAAAVAATATATATMATSNGSKPDAAAEGESATDVAPGATVSRSESLASQPAPGATSRRRAPPPPPPPASSAQGSRSRSVKRKSTQPTAPVAAAIDTSAAADAGTTTATGTISDVLVLSEEPAEEQAELPAEGSEVAGVEQNGDSPASAVADDQGTPYVDASTDVQTPPQSEQADVQGTDVQRSMPVAAPISEQVVPDEPVPKATAAASASDAIAGTSEPNVTEVPLAAEPEDSTAIHDSGDCVVPEMGSAQIESIEASTSSASPKVTAVSSTTASQPTAARPSHRGRRVDTNGPLPVTMHVRETLDYDFNYIPVGRVDFKHQVTGEVVLRVQNNIAPLELAPLRLCVKRPENAQLVANPAVVTLDTTITATTADGHEWYRFVRPNLFAQVQEAAAAAAQGGDAQGVTVVVFKYHNGVCGMMLFYEPNTTGFFAGDTIVAPAILLSLNGKIISQASRPTGVWYKERNSLLWKLDDVEVPAAMPQPSESEILPLSKTLVVKVQAEGRPVPGPVALKFEARNSKLVDAQIKIVRVAAGAQSVSTVVEGPVSTVVKSGKCIYNFKLDDDELGVAGTHASAAPADGDAAAATTSTAAAAAAADESDSNAESADDEWPESKDSEGEDEEDDVDDSESVASSKSSSSSSSSSWSDAEEEIAEPNEAAPATSLAE
ncbi:hypothetical protein GQ54DRAFT_163444 [Martensiomyces pterosporus]|nr:hypothetical protein GQ54DRAFT_163444 [Martensiomyces pterosporus]